MYKYTDAPIYFFFNCSNNNTIYFVITKYDYFWKHNTNYPILGVVKLITMQVSFVN